MTKSAAPPAGAAAASYDDDLLAVVAEKTGYPVDALDAGMDLDADLGIDSIKRVEILSAFQERRPDAPSVDAEHLGSLRTLGDITGYLAERAGPATACRSLPASATTSDTFDADLLAVVAEKTGYPVDALDAGMDLDADLGIDSIKRVEILSAFQEKRPDAPSVDAEHLGSLRTLGDIIAYLAERAGPLKRTEFHHRDTIGATITKPTIQRRLTLIYWLSSPKKLAIQRTPSKAAWTWTPILASTRLNA